MGERVKKTAAADLNPLELDMIEITRYDSLLASNTDGRASRARGGISDGEIAPFRCKISPDHHGTCGKKFQSKRWKHATAIMSALGIPTRSNCLQEFSYMLTEMEDPPSTTHRAKMDFHRFSSSFQEAFHDLMFCRKQ